jgi:tRNA A37 N6-isopentenylltransferase MiaA
LSKSGTVLEKEREFLAQEILPRLMSPLSKGALTPIEILVQLHVNESNLGIKKTIESKLC